LTNLAKRYDNRNIGKPLNVLNEKKGERRRFHQEARRSPKPPHKEAILSIASPRASGKPNMPYRLRPSVQEGQYIRYRLNLSGKKLTEISQGLGLHRDNTHKVICGLRRSVRIESEIARILGKADWNEVVLEARSEVQGKPVEVIVQELEQKLRAEKEAMSESMSNFMTEQLANQDWTEYEKAFEKRMRRRVPA